MDPERTQFGGQAVHCSAVGPVQEDRAQSEEQKEAACGGMRTRMSKIRKDFI